MKDAFNKYLQDHKKDWPFNSPLFGQEEVLKEFFNAGAAAMRDKAAEVASNYPTNTKMMVIGSGLIAGAIRKLEVN